MADPARGDEADLERATLVRSVHCQACGYDLRGLPLGGSCPECGHAAWGSVQAVLDPAARRLPILNNPGRVGNALVALMACLLLGTVLWLTPVVVDSASPLLLPSGVVRTDVLPLVAGLLVALGLWPVFVLRPPRGAADRTGVRRDVRLLGVGITGLALALIVEWIVRPAQPAGPVPAAALRWLTLLHLVALAFTVVAMIALRRVLLTIGEHSREFRTARGGRQRVHDLIAAVVGMAIGVVLRLLASETGLDGLHAVGTVVLWISTFMVVVGETYLLVNAGWIRRSLRRPPPRLADLVDHDLSPAPGPSDR